MFNIIPSVVGFDTTGSVVKEERILTECNVLERLNWSQVKDTDSRLSNAYLLLFIVTQCHNDFWN